MLFSDHDGAWSAPKWIHHPSSWKIYIGYLLVMSASSLQDDLDGLEVCPWCRSSLSHRPLRTRYCFLRSSASAICSEWHSTDPTCPGCNWTTSWQSTDTEPSATSTTIMGPVGERLQAGTEDAPVHDSTALYDFFQWIVISFPCKSRCGRRLTGLSVLEAETRCWHFSQLTANKLFSLLTL